jgi:zinc transporter 1/2/3
LYRACYKLLINIRYCVDDAGEDVEILMEAAESTDGTHTDDSHTGETSEEPAGSEEHCHFHAGVE